MKRKIGSVLLSMTMLGALLGGCGSPEASDEGTAPDKVQTENSQETEKVPEADANGILSTGPNGEKATPASEITLTDEEKEKIRSGGYKAAISLHYGGNDWATSQIEGLKATFEELGIELVATTDADFSAEQQDYVSCVSADNYGNGCVAAELMGEALGGKGQIGMVYYDADFFVTNQRDDGFRKTMADKYPEIEIVTEQGYAILTQYPMINGIYASWDVPMEGVLSSVKASGLTSEEVKLTTIDLGNNIAKEIAEGNVVGLGAQLPYDQGVAEATLAAYSLLGKEAPTYVAVSAKRVEQSNILEAYEDVYHAGAPDWLEKAAGK